MINTDASGAGSLVYGKTSDHVLALSSVLYDGSVLDTEVISLEGLNHVDTVVKHPLGQKLIREVASLCRENRSEIDRKFPVLNRF